MRNNGSEGALLKTIIGGSDSVGSQLDFDAKDGADDLDVSTSEYRDIFKDIGDTLEPKNEFLGEILNSGRELYVPTFQRRYSWEDENHDQFWASVMDLFTSLHSKELESGKLDLKPAGSEDRLEEFYFGTIYLAEETDGETGDEIYEVIDGQQRLATLFIVFNQINKRLKSYEVAVDDSAEYSSNTHEGIKFFRGAMVRKLLYTNIMNDGNGNSLRLNMTAHDDPYFKSLFDEKISRVAEYLEGMKDGSFPDWRLIRGTIEDDLERAGELEDLELEDLNLDESYDSLDEVLDQSKYKAGSHEKLISANKQYGEYIDLLLDEELDLGDNELRKRSIALINLSVILLSAFRIVRCRFTSPVDDTLKIDVFKSLNETGSSLDLHDKIRARVVAKFGINSDPATTFDSLVEYFGEDSGRIKEYLVDYLLSVESETIYKKGTINDNLLQAFATRKSSMRPIPSRLVEEDDDDDSPEEFIKSIEKHADKYRDLKSAGSEEKFSLDSSYFDDDTIQYECESILQDLNGDQWRPFVFRMYVKLAEDSTIVNEQFFRDMLELTEIFMIRSSFSRSKATAIDQVFIAGCYHFNNANVPDFGDISVYDEDDDWIEATEEFSSNTRQIMEAHFINESSWGKLSGGEIVRNMHSPSWSNPKNILKKIGRKNALSSSGLGRSGPIGPRKIDFASIEREHIFPQNPTQLSKENEYAWYQHFFKIDEDDAPSEELRAVYESAVDDDTDEERIQDRLNDLSEAYLEDIGNSIILQDDLNNKVSNRLFSIKIIWYYLRCYRDLTDFGEYLGDYDNLDIEVEDFVKLVCEFGSALNDGEIKLLLKVTVGVFETVSIDNINSWTTDVTISQEPRITPSEFSDEFDELSKFYEEFDLDGGTHSDLRNRYDLYEINDAKLVHETDDNEEVKIKMFINDSIESIISKIASKYDETTREESDSDGDDDDIESTDTADDLIVTEFNKKWNWKKVVDRKSSLIIELKKLVQLDTVNDEFRDHDSNEEEMEYHKRRVEEALRY
ncbi:hypothetical protein JCM17823_04970 [Halorubrum gandharaense]